MRILNFLNKHLVFIVYISVALIVLCIVVIEVLHKESSLDFSKNILFTILVTLFVSFFGFLAKKYLSCYLARYYLGYGNCEKFIIVEKIYSNFLIERKNNGDRDVEIIDYCKTVEENHNQLQEITHTRIVSGDDFMASRYIIDFLMNLNLQVRISSDNDNIGNLVKFGLDNLAGNPEMQRIGIIYDNNRVLGTDGRIILDSLNGKCLIFIIHPINENNGNTHILIAGGNGQCTASGARYLSEHYDDIFRRIPFACHLPCFKLKDNLLIVLDVNGNDNTRLNKILLIGLGDHPITNIM